MNHTLMSCKCIQVGPVNLPMLAADCCEVMSAVQLLTHQIHIAGLQLCQSDLVDLSSAATNYDLLRKREDNTKHKSMPSGVIRKACQSRSSQELLLSKHLL